jgi:hypothetical protein
MPRFSKINLLMDWLSNGNASKSDGNLLSANSKLIEFLKLKSSKPLTPQEIEMMTSVLSGKTDAAVNERLDRFLENLKKGKDSHSSPIRNQFESTFTSVIGSILILEAAKLQSCSFASINCWKKG